MNEKNTDSQAVGNFLMSRFEPVVAGKSWQGLELFHQNNKYLLMGLDPGCQKILGRIVSSRHGIQPITAIEQYRSLLEEIGEKSWQKGRLINMCLHVFGYFRDSLISQQKADFLGLIKSYEDGTCGIDTVIAKLREWALIYDQAYLAQQTIFEYF